MQKKSTNITLKSYLDLHQLLNIYKGSHEKNRTFALSQEKKHGKQKKIPLLNTWQDENRFKIVDELDSSKYLHYLKIFTSLVGFLLLVFGFITGFALLSYSGAQPVNVIYLLLVMVGLPLLSMSLSLLSMFTGDMGSKFFNHFSPMYYLEKVLNFFPFAKQIQFEDLPFSAKLSKWIFLQRLQLFSFLFSLGLFFALLLMVVAKDIAFGWSTTLQVSADSFQFLLSFLSYPWQTFFPSAVPSLELVELSHYFRLGEKLDSNMIQNADKLGAWWKFLAMATVTYALVLRAIFGFLTHWGFNRQLKREFLALDEAQTLLREFETPYVSTQSHKVEEHLDTSITTVTASEETLNVSYERILGWNYSENTLLLVEDHNGVKAKKVNVVGGRNSFKEDQEILDVLEKDVLLYVKAWEPPTMDFMDFLEDLLANKKVKKVDVCPLGTVSNAYASKTKDLEIWLRKLEQIDSSKLGVLDV